LRGDDFAEPILADADEGVVVTVAERHSTYGARTYWLRLTRMLQDLPLAV
jgi:hypothetical protein